MRGAVVIIAHIIVGTFGLVAAKTDTTATYFDDIRHFDQSAERLGIHDLGDNSSDNISAEALALVAALF